MGSPAYFAKLANFEASLRKPALIPFGLFNAQDNLGFIASIPGAGMSFTQASELFNSTQAIDSSAADVITVLVTGNITIMTINYAGSSTIPLGQRFWLRLVEDATGGWTVALPVNLHYDQGFAIDTGATRINILPMRWNGSNWGVFREPVLVAGLALFPSRA